MARRKTGRDISGWVVIDKPANMSSAAVVNKVRWAFDARKAGHAGTLDPQATGILAIALGEATKTVPYVTDALKTYRFTVRLGQSTNTDDADGEIIASSPIRPDTEEIEAALAPLTGHIMQVPPQFSAVKIDGERAYKRARDGDTLTLAPRPLYVDRLDLIARPDPDHVELELVCGKGGYVRAIARDLGEALGCSGHVTRLRRTRTGPFNVDEALTLDRVETLARSPDLDRCLLPLETGLADLPELRCTATQAARLRNGNPGEVLTSNAEYGDIAWASEQGKPVAVGTYRAGALHPTRVFNL